MSSGRTRIYKAGECATPLTYIQFENHRPFPCLSLSAARKFFAQVRVRGRRSSEVTKSATFGA